MTEYADQGLFYQTRSVRTSRESNRLHGEQVSYIINLFDQQELKMYDTLREKEEARPYSGRARTGLEQDAVLPEGEELFSYWRDENGGDREGSLLQHIERAKSAAMVCWGSHKEVV